MSNIRTSLPIPTQPWESGKAKFLEGLSQQQAAQFRDATAENLFYDASVAQKRHANNSRSWLLQERLSSLVNAIDDYGKALDVYSNTYGLVISPLWGSLRIILHIAGEAGKFQESLTDMLAQIGDVLPRFRIYQILFSNHERLLVALSSAFLDVLGFCITTKEFFTRAKRSKIPLSIVLKGAWKPYRQDFDGYMNKFRKHSKKVEKEAGIAHFIESARSREVQRANRELQLRNGKLHRRHQILSAIPTSSYWSMQSKMSNLRHPKSNKWIQDTAEYLSWYSSPGSDCLCCYGIPGSGKSVLAASLVDDLLACAAGPRTLVIYYYCDFAENSSLEPICLLSCLIKQVLERVPLDQFTDSFDCPLKEGKPAPNLQKTLDYLADLIKIFDRAYIILDGLDQLTTDGQTVVLDIIQNLLYNATIISKIFVTSRLEEYIIKRSLKSHKTIQLSNGCTQDDMELFITESITSTLIPQNPLLKDARLREDVIKALLKGANGMYLWVKFQLYDIAHVMTEHVMRTTIQNLPKNLSKTYARILENVRLSPGGSVKLETMQKVFRWVAGARRPLTLTELEEAVGLEKTDKYLHLDRIATGAGERLIASCSNLVVLNEADCTVSFAHHTVQQFLCSSAGPANLWPHFNLQSINEHIADICLAYLSFSDFETQLTKVSEVKLEQTQAELLVWWGVPLATSIKGLLTLPRALRKAAINKNPHGQIKFPAPVTMQPSDTLATKYAMLDYIIAFWAFHTADITPESSSWPVFKHIASEKQLAFGFRPWDEPEHCDRVQQLRLKKTKENDGGGAQNSLSWRPVLPYAWAMRHGIGSLLPLIDRNGLTVYIDFMNKDLEGRELENHWIRQPQVEKELDLLLDITFTQGPSQPSQDGFWSGQLVLHLISKYDDTFLPDEHKVRRLLDFALAECARWTDSEKHHDSMLCQAVPLVLESDDIQLFTRLIHYYVRDQQQFAVVLVAVVRGGHVRWQVLETLLYHRFSGQGENKDMWEILFALYQCSRTLETIVPYDTEAFTRMSFRILQSLLIFILAVWKQPRHLPRMVSVLKDRTSHLQFPLYLGEVDWRRTSFGTEELYNAIRKLEGHTLASDALAIHRLADLFKDLDDGYLSDEDIHELPVHIIDILDDVGLLFSAEGFESDGIHCLRAAIEKLSCLVVQKLVPFYTNFLEDEQNADMSREIIKSAAVADAKKSVVVVSLAGSQGPMSLISDDNTVAGCLSGIQWPESVLKGVRDGYVLPEQWLLDLMPSIKRGYWLRVMGFDSLIK